MIQCIDEPVPAVRLVWDGEPDTGPTFTTLDGNGYDLMWPRGFSARIREGRIELIDPSGTVVARGGDELPELGGATTNIVCRVGQFVYGPAL